MKQNLALCLRACKLECVRLNDCISNADYCVDVKNVDSGDFVIYSKTSACFHSWEGFVKLVEGFHVSAYFGLVHAETTHPSVGLFVFAL